MGASSRVRCLGRPTYADPRSEFIGEIGGLSNRHSVFFWDRQSNSCQPISELVASMDRELATQQGHPDDNWLSEVLA